MFRLLLRLFLALLFARFVVGIVRYLSGGGRASRLENEPDRERKAAPRSTSRPLVDRSNAIDVPFTEEGSDPAPGAPSGDARSGPV